jgi:hypothetical protein
MEEDLIQKSGHTETDVLSKRTPTPGVCVSTLDPSPRSRLYLVHGGTRLTLSGNGASFNRDALQVDISRSRMRASSKDKQ